THGWAVGYDSYDDSPTFAKWDGATWTNATPTNLTATASLRGVAAITPTDVWVVGEYSKPSALATSPLASSLERNEMAVLPSTERARDAARGDLGRRDRRHLGRRLGARRRPRGHHGPALG